MGDQLEGRDQKSQKVGDVIYGWPLIEDKIFIFLKSMHLVQKFFTNFRNK